ncbi:MAG: hypothetical protein JW808_02195 [Victivallales bacterium]|nr:hypothetical protein [Victivallales bacterium]
MDSKGFLTTLISVCSGTSGFPGLIKRPFWIVAWHLFVLALLCGCVNVALRLHPFMKDFENLAKILKSRFGSIEFSEAGMLPSNTKEGIPISATYGKFRVDFVPDEEKLHGYKGHADFDHGIVWTPKSLLFWMRHYDDENLSILPLLLPEENLKMPSQMYGLFKEASSGNRSSPPFYTLSQMYLVSPSENIGRAPVEFRDFKSNILMWIPLTIPQVYSVFLFASIVFSILVVSMLYILFFTSFSYMFGTRKLMKLSFLQLFACGVYTGFPGFLIATLYVALQLPFLDFQTTFLIAYFIYSFAVFSRLRNTFLPKKELPRQEDFDF